jgi:dipeptidyl aminopeptidase/acylaminoacyl peptidase
MSDGEILFTEFSGGSTAIDSLDVLRKTTKKLWEGPETVHAGSAESSLSVSRKEASPFQIALIRTSWSMLPEVWAGPVGRWRQVTRINAAVDLHLPTFENVTWTSGRFQVQGWLLYPRYYDPRKHYPMLVAVHGGPAWIATPAWRMPDFNTTLFTDFGYFVFFPNARGSYGQGEFFTQANRRDWGFGDLQDMLKGIDTVVTHYPVDNNRVGLLGWSYGGSTAMMAITQTHRFRAAVAGAGAGDWQSYYGQNAIDKWMIPYFGASVYDDPKAYERCSALTYIKNARTPTLVLVGERDGEAPPAQSIQFWHALKELSVPTKLVIYADEGHSFLKQDDRIDVTLRTLQWSDTHMHAY